MELWENIGLLGIEGPYGVTRKRVCSSLCVCLIAICVYQRVVRGFGEPIHATESVYTGWAHRPCSLWMFVLMLVNFLHMAQFNVTMRLMRINGTIWCRLYDMVVPKR